jgi:hypothetical protein
MSSVRSIIAGLVNWVAANTKSFSYLLPDTLELALYLGLAAYYALQLHEASAF